MQGTSKSGSSALYFLCREMSPHIFTILNDDKIKKMQYTITDRII